MKIKNLFILFLATLGIMLTGCGNSDNVDTNDGLDSTSSNESATAMVVYFSATGNTEEVAKFISDYIDSPIYELEPIDQYTSDDLNYSNSDSRVCQERNDPNHLTELVNVNFDEFDESDYIFLGAPIWWGELSFVINDFVLSNDFTNKTIIPFATASSSNFNVNDLKHLSNEANWLEGRRFRQSEINEENVHNWIDSLNINF